MQYRSFILFHARTMVPEVRNDNECDLAIAVSRKSPRLDKGARREYNNYKPV